MMRYDKHSAARFVTSAVAMMLLPVAAAAQDAPPVEDTPVTTQEATPDAPEENLAEPSAPASIPALLASISGVAEREMPDSIWEALNALEPSRYVFGRELLQGVALEREAVAAAVTLEMWQEAYAPSIERVLACREAGNLPSCLDGPAADAALRMGAFMLDDGMVDSLRVSIARHPSGVFGGASSASAFAESYISELKRKIALRLEYVASSDPRPAVRTEASRLIPLLMPEEVS